MKFLLYGLGNWYDRWELLKTTVAEVEDVGYWGVLLPDHYMWRLDADIPPGVRGDATLDSWIALTSLAAKTERIRLGTLVTPIPRYWPSALAKIVSTLDVISGGRTILGVGAGSSQREFEAYGQWTEPRIRVEQTEEGVELIRKLWTQSIVNFTGRYYHARNAVLEPKPLQKPHPPLLFGGEKRRMLRLAGRYADICLIPPWVKMSYGQAREMVHREAQRHRRESKLSFAALELSPKFEPREHARQVQAAQGNGCTYFIIGFWHETYLDSIRKFAAEIVPSFGD